MCDGLHFQYKNQFNSTIIKYGFISLMGMSLFIVTIVRVYEY